MKMEMDSVTPSTMPKGVWLRMDLQPIPMIATIWKLKLIPIWTKFVMR